MGSTVFSPQHRSLDEIFSSQSTYSIPAYQRPYCWQSLGKSDRDSQVIQLWEDLIHFFQENHANSKEYFLGSMVIIQDPSKVRTFSVIDGQQRLTTLLLLFAAMRCFLRKQAPRAPAELQSWCGKAIDTLTRFIYNEAGFGLAPELKLKIMRTIGPDMDRILESSLACEDESSALALPEKHQAAALRYYRNRAYFEEQIQGLFLAGPDRTLNLQKAAEFDGFFRFLQARVALVIITTTDFETAYGIFEILNNRGLQLNNLDLLRNFLMQEMVLAQLDAPEQRWERLEQDYRFTEDFLGRWTESVRAAQPHTSAFNDVVRFYQDPAYEPTSPGQRRIDRFMADLERNLGYYTLISDEDRIEDTAVRHAIAFIKLLGNERYGTDLLLALLRRFDYDGGAADPAMLAFLRVYRRHALYVYLLGRFSSAQIYAAIRALRDGDDATARHIFALGPQERRQLVESLRGPIRSNEQAKRLLAAYYWYAEETDPQDVVDQQLVFDRVTLEHILPQEPAAGTNWSTDFDAAFREEYTHRLGNMTLVTLSRNASLRNFGWDRKRAAYERTRLRLTVDLAASETLTPDDIRRRHEAIVGALLRLFELDATAI